MPVNEGRQTIHQLDTPYSKYFGNRLEAPSALDCAKSFSSKPVEDDIRRRYNELQRNEWQYEGLPIDLDGFRRAVRAEEDEWMHTTRPTPTTTRTTATEPTTGELIEN